MADESGPSLRELGAIYGDDVDALVKAKLAIEAQAKIDAAEADGFNQGVSHARAAYARVLSEQMRNSQ